MNFDEECEESRIQFRINDWDLNNEFNHKRSSMSNRKESVYDNFNSSDSEDDKCLETQKRKIINFISGGNKDQINDQNIRQDIKPEEGEEEEDYDCLPSNKRNKSMKSKKSEQQFAGMRRVGVIGTDEEFGRWESHTRGIGAKLLSKMGFQPGKGLGKNLQGITTPVEAKKRPGFGAIGRYGTEHKVRPMTTEEEIEEKIKIKQKLKAENEWKKTEQNTKRSVKVMKSADQIIAENLLRPWNECEVNKVKVIDMTGPEHRVLEGYHQINQQNNSTVPEEDNINDLIGITEQEIRENEKELKRESQRYQSLEEEIQRLNDVIEKERQQSNEIEGILGIIDELIERLNENQISIEDVLKILDEIRTENPLEFDSLKLHEILIPTAFPLFRELLNDWKSLENCDSVKHVFIELRRITSGHKDSIYDFLLWEIWMPVVRRQLLEWPSIRQCDEVIALLESWRPLVPEWLFDNIVEQIVLPLLQKEVEEWNPLTDTVPIHSWLHPWLPLMADRSLEHLYGPIRHKLSNALTNWYPSDSSAKLILEPWKGVFSGGAMEAFLNINIVPKLEISMQSLLINPHQQVLDVWHWVMSWQDLLSTPVLAAILEKHFFPRWLNVLYNWLSNAPDFNEVHKWYLGWKSMLAPQLVSYPSIEISFKTALDMMNHSTQSNGPLKPFHTFYTPIRPQTQTNSSAISVKVPEVSVNFRELVERKAEERGILFMPIPNRYHEGRQMYRFGKLTVHIDNKVLFVLKDNKWIPISIDSMIESSI